MRNKQFTPEEIEKYETLMHSEDIDDIVECIEADYKLDKFINDKDKHIRDIAYKHSIQKNLDCSGSRFFDDWLKDNAIIYDDSSNTYVGMNEDGYYEDYYEEIEGIVQIEEDFYFCTYSSENSDEPHVSTEKIESCDIKSRMQKMVEQPSGYLTFSDKANEYFPNPEPDAQGNLYFIAEKPCKLSVLNYSNSTGCYEPSYSKLRIEKDDIVAVVGAHLEINGKKFFNYDFDRNFGRMPQLKQIAKPEKNKSKDIERD